MSDEETQTFWEKFEAATGKNQFVVGSKNGVYAIRGRRYGTGDFDDEVLEVWQTYLLRVNMGAEKQDIDFAKNRLAELCKEKGIPFFPSWRKFRATVG